ncbi:MAG: ArsR/SmtB family transcription factor [Halobacteriales archaeon]
MASSQSVFPVRDSVDVDSSPSVISIEAAGEVLETLRTENAREILNQLYADPATASDIAGGIDTSLQNVQYHLEQLREAGLVDVVDTWYSAKGTEMKVYGPEAEPLVICAGTAESAAGVRQAVDRGD